MARERGHGSDFDDEGLAAAVAVIGGQSLSLLLTLIMCPVAYSLIDDVAIRVRSAFKRSMAPARQS